MWRGAVVLPVGGGGLSSGLISYFGTECTYTFVEPKGGACLRAALKAGRPVKLDKVDTFADGAAVKTIGTESFRLCQKYVDGMVTVNTDQICNAIKLAYNDA